ncbi:MAG: vitamin K epoxide reductase family protein [Acidimicrobiales bacterium]
MESRTDLKGKPADVVASGYGWLPTAAWLVSLAGLAVATYLTIAHYDTHVHLACSSSGLINCEQVTTSPQSVIFGIPVAVLGLAYFTVMSVLNAPLVWRRAPARAGMVRLVLAMGGMGFVLYLVYAELVLINAICLWCTTTHVLAFGLFILVLLGSTRMQWWPGAEESD